MLSFRFRFVVMLAGVMIVPALVSAQPAPDPGETGAPAADAASPAEDTALRLAAANGELSVLREEASRLRAQVAQLTEQRAAAQARVALLEHRLQQRTLVNGGGIALASVLFGVLLARLTGRRRRGGF